MCAVVGNFIITKTLIGLIQYGASLPEVILGLSTTQLNGERDIEKVVFNLSINPWARDRNDL